jgi:hypothetical protein
MMLSPDLILGGNRALNILYNVFSTRAGCTMWLAGANRLAHHVTFYIGHLLNPTLHQILSFTLDSLIFIFSKTYASSKHLTYSSSDFIHDDSAFHSIHHSSSWKQVQLGFFLCDETHLMSSALFADVSHLISFFIHIFCMTFLLRWSYVWKNRVLSVVSASTCLSDEDEVCDEDILMFWIRVKIWWRWKNKI